MIPNQDRFHTIHYFSTLFLEFSLKIIQEIEEKIGGESITLTTPQDKGTTIFESNKKIKASRNAKYQGDLCLLAGANKDAGEFYQSCLEGIKTIASELLWLAAAYEGMACVRLVEALQKYNYNLV